MKAIELADYLLIAADVLDIDAERLARGANLASLESALNAPFAGWGDQDVYPTLHEKAAILCSRLIRNHPLVDGNKRAAYVATVVFIEINGGLWRHPEDRMEVARTVWRLAGREISEADFAAWVAERLRP
jgi:death-on-curing protein